MSKEIEPQNILVTGGEGFVGRNVRRRLNATPGVTAESYDLVTPGNPRDILDVPTLTKAMEGKTGVVHLAARISVVESEKEPGKYWETNVAGTVNVLRAAAEAGVETVVFASSAAVHNPDNPYGMSKLQGEHLMTEYSDRLTTVSPRFFNIYGEGQNPVYAGVITAFDRFARNGDPITVNGDGEQTRDFIAVEDIAEIVSRFVTKEVEVPSGSVFEVGTGSSVTINHLAEIFSEIGGGVPIEHVDGGPVGIVHSKSDNTSLVEALGGYEFTPLEVGLQKFADKDK